MTKTLEKVNEIEVKGRHSTLPVPSLYRSGYISSTYKSSG